MDGRQAALQRGARIAADIVQAIWDIMAPVLRDEHVVVAIRHH